MQTAKSIAGTSKLSKGQQRLLAVLQCEENRSKSVKAICELAGYPGTKNWYYALRKEPFARAVEDLGLDIKRQKRSSHLEVQLGNYSGTKEENVSLH